MKLTLKNIFLFKNSATLHVAPASSSWLVTMTWVLQKSVNMDILLLSDAVAESCSVSSRCCWSRKALFFVKPHSTLSLFLVQPQVDAFMIHPILFLALVCLTWKVIFIFYRFIKKFLGRKKYLCKYFSAEVFVAQNLWLPSHASSWWSRKAALLGS